MFTLSFLLLLLLLLLFSSTLHKLCISLSVTWQRYHIMPIFVSLCNGTFLLQPFFFFLIVRWCCSSQHFTLNLYFSHFVVHLVNLHVVLLFPTHCFHVICAGIPHTLFIFPSIMWGCCFRHIFILCVLVFLTQFSLLYPSCGDAVSATFLFYVGLYSLHIVHHSIFRVVMLLHSHFMYGYSLHIVHHSIFHVVMLFPPCYYFCCMCAGIPHTLFIILYVMW